MRYIYYIAAIVILSSLLVGYQLFDSSHSAKKAALVINDRIISYEEFGRLYASRDPHLQDKDDFITTLITKELLIQEARKGGVDQEESFRQSIQNYYEQSLVKLFLDRKFASLSVSVSDDEVKKYAALIHKRLHVTLFRYESAEEARKAAPDNGEKKILSFEELSREMKCAVLSLEEGQTCGPHRLDGKYVVLKLDKIEDIRSPQPPAPQPAAIRKILIEEKKEEMLNDWLDDLKKRSRIKILTEGIRQGR